MYVTVGVISKRILVSSISPRVTSWIWALDMQQSEYINADNRNEVDSVMGCYFSP